MKKSRFDTYPEVEEYKADLPDRIGNSASLWGKEICEMALEKEKLQERLEIVQEEYEALCKYGFPRFYEEGKKV